MRGFGKFVISILIAFAFVLESGYTAILATESLTDGSQTALETGALQITSGVSVVFDEEILNMVLRGELDIRDVDPAMLTAGVSADFVNFESPTGVVENETDTVEAAKTAESESEEVPDSGGGKGSPESSENSENSTFLTYQNIGIANVKEFLNVRTKPSASAESIAKLYPNGACDILEVDGDWARIRSGDIEGYVNYNYLYTGRDAIEIAEKSTEIVATVTVDRLRLRSEATTDSRILTVLKRGMQLQVLSLEDDWVSVGYNGQEGHVFADYVSISDELSTAVALAEEKPQEDAAERSEETKARETKSDETKKDSGGTVKDKTETTGKSDETKSDKTEEKVDKASKSAETQADEAAKKKTDSSSGKSEDSTGKSAIKNTGQTDTENTVEEADDTGQKSSGSKDKDSAKTEKSQKTDKSADSGKAGSKSEKSDSSAKSDKASSSGGSDTRTKLVNTALSYVGNPYRWGGTSLTNGVDCSGFTMKIYEKYGISLPHSSRAQSSKGKKIKASQAQPGDLFFYGGGGGISHVAIYIGDGKVVHASTKKTGIKVSNAYYKKPVCVVSCLD